MIESTKWQISLLVYLNSCRDFKNIQCNVLFRRDVKKNMPITISSWMDQIFLNISHWFSKRCRRTTRSSSVTGKPHSCNWILWQNPYYSNHPLDINLVQNQSHEFLESYISYLVSRYDFFRLYFVKMKLVVTWQPLQCFKISKKWLLH